MAEPVARDDGLAALLALDPKRISDEAAADWAGDDKKFRRATDFANNLVRELRDAKYRRLEILAEEARQEKIRLRKLRRASCRSCGSATGDLTACLCFDSTDSYEGGAILCVECCAKDDHVTRCKKCNQLLCLVDGACGECCRSMEESFLCGYDEDCGESMHCSAAICSTCYREGSSGWNNCFCGKMKFCPSCSLSGNSAFARCESCGTLYCSDESGDCGRECEQCMEKLCCKCLGVNDPRSLDLCDGCKPFHKKRSYASLARECSGYSDESEESCHY